MKDIYDRIIKKIERNRISTTEIADCLAKTGALEDVLPLNRGHFKVGKIKLVYGYNEANGGIHEQVQEFEEDRILIVETHNCNNRAVFGELVSKYLILYKRVKAIVAIGNMRDVSWLYKENYPIWCKGVTPLGCFNQVNKEPIDPKVMSGWKEKYDGAIGVCDDGGVVIIPKKEINEEFLKKLDFIELQEDIWSYCVNTMKWTTYDTVYLKKYLDTKLLPKELKDDFEKFQKETDK